MDIMTGAKMTILLANIELIYWTVGSSSKDKCRLAVRDDLKQIVALYHLYDQDEPLGKTIGAGDSYGDSLEIGFGEVIDMGGLIVAYDEANETDFIGFTLFYTRKVMEKIENDTLTREKRLEEASLAYAKELGMEVIGPMYGICHLCFGWDKLETEFTYLELLFVKREFRGKGIATLLVQEFENVESARSTPVWISVATAVGTSKILTKLGWEAYSTSKTENYEYFGTKPFEKLKHEITAFRKSNTNNVNA